MIMNMTNLVYNSLKKIYSEQIMPNKVLKDLAKIVIDGFNKVNSRLDVLENDVKEIKSLPTVKNELKSQKKKK